MNLKNIWPEFYRRIDYDVIEAVEHHINTRNYSKQSFDKLGECLIQQLKQTPDTELVKTLDTFIFLDMYATKHISKCRRFFNSILEKVRVIFKINNKKTLSKVLKKGYSTLLYKSTEQNTISEEVSIFYSGLNPANCSFEAYVESRFIRTQLSASTRGFDFNLTREDIAELLKRKTCYYTGARFSNTYEYRRTFERLDNSKGYIKGNVVAVIHKANKIKNIIFEKDLDRLTAKQFIMLIQRVNEIGVY